MSVTVLNTTASLSGKTLMKLEDSQSITGAKTYDRGASTPFVCISGSAKVDFLDSDKLDGQEGAYYADVFTWTPTLTFAVAGDLNVVYTTRIGRGQINGTKVKLWCHILTSTFTHTTATGVLIISGNPQTAMANGQAVGSCSWQGITKANYTDIVTSISASATNLGLIASGSGQGAASIAFGDMPTGGTVQLICEIEFRTA